MIKITFLIRASYQRFSLFFRLVLTWHRDADLCFVGQIFATPHSPRVFIGLNAQETMALFHKPTQEKVF